MSHDKAHGFEVLSLCLCRVCFLVCRSIRAMNVVSAENAHNKSLIYSGTEALSKPSTGWGNLKGQETNSSFDEAFVEFPSRWDLNATVAESETAIQIIHNCQTNGKYNIRQITNTKSQTENKCQTVTDDPLAECHLKELKVRNTKEQMVIEGNPKIPERLVNAFIEEKRQNHNKRPVQLSSNCHYRNADESVNVRNSRATIVSHPQLRMRREREPSRITYKMVTRLSHGKETKKSVKLYIKKYVPKSSKLKAMLFGYHRYHFLKRYRSPKFMPFTKKCFITQACVFFEQGL